MGDFDPLVLCKTSAAATSTLCMWQKRLIWIFMRLLAIYCHFHKTNNLLYREQRRAGAGLDITSGDKPTSNYWLPHMLVLSLDLLGGWVAIKEASFNKIINLNQ